MSYRGMMCCIAVVLCGTQAAWGADLMFTNRVTTFAGVSDPNGPPSTSKPALAAATAPTSVAAGLYQAFQSILTSPSRQSDAQAKVNAQMLSNDLAGVIVKNTRAQGGTEHYFPFLDADSIHVLLPDEASNFSDSELNEFGQNVLKNKDNMEAALQKELSICDLTAGNTKACVVYYNSTDQSPTLSDVSATPTKSNTTLVPVKVALARYRIKLGDSIYIPFSILSSSTSNSSKPGDTNSLKMLDPEQGILNAELQEAVRFRIGRICQFSNYEKGGCTVGGNLGVRYLSLQNSSGSSAPAASTNTNSSTNDVGSTGEYAQVALAVNLPIYDASTVGDSSSGDAGSLVFNLGASWFHQKTAQGQTLFPDAKDATGAPITVGSTYAGTVAQASLSITNKFSVKASYYNGWNGETRKATGNQSTVTFSYNTN